MRRPVFVDQEGLVEMMMDAIESDGMCSIGWIGERRCGKTTAMQTAQKRLIDRLYPRASEWERWLYCYKLTCWTPLQAIRVWRKVSMEDVADLPTVDDFSGHPVLPTFAVDDAAVNWNAMRYRDPIFVAIREINPALGKYVKNIHWSMPTTGDVLRFLTKSMTIIVQVFKRKTRDGRFVRYCLVQRKRGGRVYYRNPSKPFEKLELQRAFPFCPLPTDVPDREGKLHDVYAELYEPKDREFRDIRLAGVEETLASHEKVTDTWRQFSPFDKRLFKSIADYFRNRRSAAASTTKLYEALRNDGFPEWHRNRFARHLLKLAAAGTIEYDRGEVALTVLGERISDTLKEQDSAKARP